MEELKVVQPDSAPRRAEAVLQISMHPNDVRHVVHILPHHLRTWSGQVDRVLVVLDVHRSRAGRYRNNAFDENLVAIRRVLNDIGGKYSLDVEEVDYSAAVRREISLMFVSSGELPDKAWDGGPFYAYFYGLWAGRAAYVLHMDSDMLYGGGSQSWMGEAISLLEARHDLLFVTPLSGPPREDHLLLGQREMRTDPDIPGAYLFPTVSTRVFLFGTAQLRERVGRLRLTAPGASQRVRAAIMGNPPVALEAEAVLSRNMRDNGLARMDLLGAGLGMWSLHPPYRSELFFRELPRLIESVEEGRIPEAQRGCYDIHDSMIDWSEQRRANTRSRRWFRHLKQIAERRRPVAAG